MRLLLITFIFFLIIFPAAYAQNYTAFGSPIQKDGYGISRSLIQRTLKTKTFFQDYMDISNAAGRDMRIEYSVSGTAQEVVELGEKGAVLPSGNTSRIYFTIIGKKQGVYEGNFEISGDISEKIPITIYVVDSMERQVIVNVAMVKKSFVKTEILKAEIDVMQILQKEIMNVSFSYSINSMNDTFFLDNETFDIKNSFQTVKKFQIPPEATEGEYFFKVLVSYENSSIEPHVSEAQFFIRKSFFQYLIFGVIPVWAAIAALFGLMILFLGFFLTRRAIKKRKKYKVDVDWKTLPKKNDTFFKFGKIAESSSDSWFEPNNLLTHTIVAGATGGGKSIAAQVIIEEALMKNVAVIVFDPTAQWSGMLRKCDDKRMFELYPKFGLKPGDAKAFNGNVRQIQDSREFIDLNKYMNPGQIQIFALNKLPPDQIDTFVASTIVSIFRSNLQEFPNLRVLLVFDEVHRLLSKFGGSGAGFLQIERACREFRKWGLGLILVSQVLSDFVAEIKANITTEIQMRTRDESDLQRINVKYGENILQSLVKASVGTGMIVNPKYNRGRPYFLTFRPILHSTKRLSDQELEKYNQYNIVYDDLEYQVEQLEKEKVDVFDFKMELKLVLDKLKQGNFSVVDIYLEGLKPRLEGAWKKLGKKPKKKELMLVDVSSIKKSVEEAKKAREAWEAKVGGGRKTEEKKQVEEDVYTKIIPSITLDNGIMLSSLKEFKEVLDVLDDSVFKVHVTKEKNDFAEWIGKNLDKELGENLKMMKIRGDGVKIIDDWRKKEKKEKEGGENKEEKEGGENKEEKEE